MDRIRRADGQGLLVRVVAPAVALWGLAVGLGFAVAGPLAGPLNAEDGLNRGALAPRGSAADLVSAVLSYLGSTEMIAAVCLVVSISLVWRTRDWRLAAVPVIAILLQLSVYLAVIALVQRERPSVDRLDHLLPMSSFPSGHVGASVALYLSLLLLAREIESDRLRRFVILVCVAVPVVVAVGRFVRGMHHASDLAAGAIIGAVCALLAHGWYVHRTAALAAAQDRAATSPV